MNNIHGSQGLAAIVDKAGAKSYHFVGIVSSSSCARSVADIGCHGLAILSIVRSPGGLLLGVSSS